MRQSPPPGTPPGQPPSVRLVFSGATSASRTPVRSNSGPDSTEAGTATRSRRPGLFGRENCQEIGFRYPMKNDPRHISPNEVDNEAEPLERQSQAANTLARTRSGMSMRPDVIVSAPLVQSISGIRAKVIFPATTTVRNVRSTAPFQPIQTGRFRRWEARRSESKGKVDEPRADRSIAARL